MIRLAFCLWLSTLAPAQEPPTTTAAGYDPLRVLAPTPPSLERTLHDEARDRDIPLRVYLPAATTPAPVILLSHGLGGTRDTCRYLGEHWSGRSFAVVAMQHPGSDDAVWRDAKPRQRMAAMQRAASGRNLELRIGDVHAVLDALTGWNDAPDDPCRGRFDLAHVGMSGHSFGAITTQMVSGQSVPLLGQHGLDPRIDAALAMSPHRPAARDRDAVFARVAIPWLLMTGTDDRAPIGDQTPDSRREVFPHLPSTVDRFQLVLDGGTHAAFTDRGLPGQRRDPGHHRAILAISTAFWDSYLRIDEHARAWLLGDGPCTVLAPADGWTGAPSTAPSPSTTPSTPTTGTR